MTLYYINHNQINNVPVLEVVNASDQFKPLPTIFFIHGFTSAKEHNLHYAYYLAEKGFRVVLPDCHLHGERSQGLNQLELSFEFWNIVTTTIAELEILYQDLVEKKKVEIGKIGLAGTSMGGIVTLGALTQFDWIETAVSLMGCPAYLEFANYQLENLKKLGVQFPFSEDQIHKQLQDLEKYDLSHQPELLKDRPIMFWHGEKDPTVPFLPAYDFYEKAKDLYPNQDLIRFYRDPKADHKVTRDGVLQTVEWFENHLKRVEHFSSK